MNSRNHFFCKQRNKSSICPVAAVMNAAATTWPPLTLVAIDERNSLEVQDLTWHFYAGYYFTLFNTDAAAPNDNLVGNKITRIRRFFYSKNNDETKVTLATKRYANCVVAWLKKEDFELFYQCHYASPVPIKLSDTEDSAESFADNDDVIDRSALTKNFLAQNNPSVTANFNLAATPFSITTIIIALSRLPLRVKPVDCAALTKSKWYEANEYIFTLFAADDEEIDYHCIASSIRQFFNKRLTTKVVKTKLLESYLLIWLNSNDFKSVLTILPATNHNDQDHTAANFIAQNQHTYTIDDILQIIHANRQRIQLIIKADFENAQIVKSLQNFQNWSWHLVGDQCFCLLPKDYSEARKLISFFQYHLYSKEVKTIVHNEQRLVCVDKNKLAIFFSWPDLTNTAVYDTNITNNTNTFFNASADSVQYNPDIFNFSLDI